MNIDHDRFQQARAAALCAEAQGIGTLGEKTLHAVLKEYYCTGGAQKEVKIGGYYADLFDGHAITEIHTRGFDRLRGKLESLLPQYPVRVVYPIAHTKWLLWLDEETGAVSKKRRSPKRGSQFWAFAELYKIKQHLVHPNFSLLITLVDLEEYRSLNGWSADKKRGSSRFDRLALGLAGEVAVNRPEDWHLLVPQGLPLQFTSRDFSAAAGITRRHAQTALNVLSFVGAVSRRGKAGQSILYSAGP